MKKGFKTLTILLSICLLFFAAFILAFYHFSSPPSSVEVSPSVFVIPKGQALGIIGRRLEEDGYIKNAFLFKLMVKQKNFEKKLQAGSFSVSPSMELDTIIFTLTKGTNDVWITIPEGWRSEEIAESLDRLELSEFNKDEFVKSTFNVEGTLFPDSYLVPKTISTSEVIELLTSTFEQKVMSKYSDDFNSSNLSFEELMVLASIIEREARSYEQMRKVSGILYNRLKIGMALQVDATLQYIKGYNNVNGSWWTPPLAVDKELDSSFNTYKITGLPPSPICNPGLDAIKAALFPLPSNNLYYLHDKNGVLHVAEDLSGHNQNIFRFLQ